MLKRLALLAVVAAGFAVPSHAATVYLTWTGANGYTMDGSFSYADGLTGILSSSDLTSFAINGYLNGSPIGSWDVASGLDGTVFNFNFDADNFVFLTGGLSDGPNGQLWHATPLTCPNPGFGFASGSSAQGFCLDGSFIGTSFVNIENSALTASLVPEPASLSLVGVGLAGLWFGTRRRRA